MYAAKSNTIKPEEVKLLNFADPRVQNAVFAGDYNLAKQLSGITVGTVVQHQPVASTYINPLPVRPFSVPAPTIPTHFAHPSQSLHQPREVPTHSMSAPATTVGIPFGSVPMSVPSYPPRPSLPTPARPLSPRSVSFSAPLQIPAGAAYSPRTPGTMYPTSPRGATGQYAEVMTPTSPRSILRGRSSYENPYYPRSPRSPRSPTSTVYNNAY